MNTNHRLILFLFGLLREDLFHSFNHHTDSTEEVSHSKGPSPNADSVDEEINQRPVNDHKGQEDTKAPPLIAIVDIKCVHILCAVSEGAVLAVFRGVRVDQVSHSSDVGDEVSCVLLTGRAWRRVEVGGFLRGTFDVDRGENA